jgi:hypothetical protein
MRGIALRRVAGVVLVSVLGPVLTATLSGAIGQVVEPTLTARDLDPGVVQETLSIILMIGFYGGLLTIGPASLAAIALAGSGARTRRTHAIAGASVGLVLFIVATAVLRSSGFGPLPLASVDVLVPGAAAVLAGGICGIVYLWIAGEPVPTAGPSPS